eukprot:COSAG05_NODE_2345_length_3199_cov_1.827419_1_plen_60_part_00
MPSLGTKADLQYLVVVTNSARELEHLHQMELEHLRYRPVQTMTLGEAAGLTTRIQIDAW